MSEGAERQDEEEGDELAQLQAYGALVLMLFMMFFSSFLLPMLTAWLCL